MLPQYARLYSLRDSAKDRRKASEANTSENERRPVKMKVGRDRERESESDVRWAF